MKRVIWILWPSFVVAAVANAIFFSMFDPAELSALWSPLPPTRVGAYTLGFFGFWAIGACSSGLTCFLQRDADELNRAQCPVAEAGRPPGCRGA